MCYFCTILLKGLKLNICYWALFCFKSWCNIIFQVSAVHKNEIKVVDMVIKCKSKLSSVIAVMVFWYCQWKFVWGKLVFVFFFFILNSWIEETAVILGLKRFSWMLSSCWKVFSGQRRIHLYVCSILPRLTSFWRHIYTILYIRLRHDPWLLQ